MVLIKSLTKEDATIFANTLINEIKQSEKTPKPGDVYKKPSNEEIFKLKVLLSMVLPIEEIKQLFLFDKNTSFGNLMYERYSNGNFYIGEYQKKWLFLKNYQGKGVLFYAIGDKYEGDWVNGNRQGKGVLSYANGSKYDGDWVNGEFHGKGVLSYADGAKYDGDWVNGEFHGKGVLFYAIGDKYEGDWVNGNRHGKGVLSYADGGKYDGDWLNDKEHGKGVYYLANGRKYESEYKNGVLLELKAELGPSILKAISNSPISFNGIAHVAFDVFLKIIKRAYLKIIKKGEKESRTNIIKKLLNPETVTFFGVRAYEISEIMEKIKNNRDNITIMSGGYEGHDITYVIYKDFLLICNRGPGLQQNKNDLNQSDIIMLPLPKNIQVIEKVLIAMKKARTEDSVAGIEIIYQNIPQLILGSGYDLSNPQYRIGAMPIQKGENCWAMSIEQAIYGAIILMLKEKMSQEQRESNIKEIEKEAKKIFESILGDDMKIEEMDVWLKTERQDYKDGEDIIQIITLLKKISRHLAPTQLSPAETIEIYHEITKEKFFLTITKILDILIPKYIPYPTYLNMIFTLPKILQEDITNNILLYRLLNFFKKPNFQNISIKASRQILQAV